MRLDADHATSSARPRLLFLAQTLPYPPDGGVKIRTYHTLRLLSRDFSILALCFYRRRHGAEHAAVEERVRALRRVADGVEAFPIPQEHHRGRLLLDHLRSIVKGRPYTHFVYGSASFRARLDCALGDPRGFDLVHMDSLDLSRYLPMLPARRLICTHHNVESRLLRRRAEREASTVRRVYMRHQARLLRLEESRWCERVAANVTVSEEDRTALREISPGARSVVIPNGVDTGYFCPVPDAEGDGLVFVGGTSWYPNKDALHYFGSDILPLVRRGSKDIPVQWVGRALPEEQREAQRHFGIELTGYVDDVRPFLARAACVVVPIRVGGGTRLKILDAWAMGKAIVSTSAGAEGLMAEDGRNILIRDNPLEFAEAVHRVLAEAGLRRRLGAAGRETAERHYAWEVVGETQRRLYRSILAEDSRPREAAGLGIGSVGEGT